MPDAMMTHQLPGSDERMFVEFYTKAEINKIQSIAQGKPVYEDVIFFKLIQPGDSRLSVYDQPARPEDKMRFPRQWMQFQAGKKQDVQGTPLSILFPTNPAIAANLGRAGVYTIEQLADLSDTGLQEVGMGARQFQKQARDYLERADQGKDYHVLADKIEKLELRAQADKDKIVALERALAEAAAKRGPGRPSNAELAARRQEQETI